MEGSLPESLKHHKRQPESLELAVPLRRLRGPATAKTKAE